MKQRSLFSILCFVLISFGGASVSAQTCSDNGYFRPNGLILWPRRKPFHITENESDTDISAAQSSQYDFKTTKAATNKFSSSNKLSEGGFGEVYKGKLSNGTEVAVKRLSKESGQGIREFKNEAVLVSKLQHRNLVRLLGFCVEGDEKILCVQV